MQISWKEFKNKKVLITGGIGFIGSSLARRLVELEANVTVMDSMIPQYGGNLCNIADIKDSITLDLRDVRDAEAIRELVEGKEYLFNLAGQTSHLDSMHDPQTDLEINSRAQLSILEAVRAKNPNIKIVFASTRQLYGKPEYLPVDEKHPILPVDVNGINKWSGEMFHLLYNKVYNIRATALRLTNTYGPGMRVKDARQTFLGIWVKNLIEGKSLQVFGDGLQLRDFNFVDDVVEAFLLAALNENANGEVLNLGSEEKISLKDLAAKMVSLYKKGEYQIVPFPEDRKAIDIGDYYSDFRKFSKITGWQPKINLTEGLLKTIAYYEKYKEYYW